MFSTWILNKIVEFYNLLDNKCCQSSDIDGK